MSKITNRIFLGNHLDAKNGDFLKRNNIQMVINVAVEVPKPNYPFPMLYYKFNLNDIPEQSLYPYIHIIYKLINDFITNNDGNILIHCYAGISRSTSLLIAYLMLKYNVPYEEAYDFVKLKRPIINPNTGFVKQLKSL